MMVAKSVPTPEQQERYRQLTALQDIKGWLVTEIYNLTLDRHATVDPVLYRALAAQGVATRAMHRVIRDETPDDPAAWLAVVLDEMQAQAAHTLVLIARMRDMMAEKEAQG